MAKNNKINGPGTTQVSAALQAQNNYIEPFFLENLS